MNIIVTTKIMIERYVCGSLKALFLKANGFTTTF
jgi:hypothetical protein